MKHPGSLLIPLLPLFLLTTIAIPSHADEPFATPAKPPNLLVNVSAKLLNAAVRKTIDRLEPVDETIDEIPVQGRRRTVTAVSAELLPDSKRAVVDVVLRGHVYAQVVGTRRHVLVQTLSTTPVELRQRVTIDANGINASRGPNVAETTTKVLDIKPRTGPPDAAALKFGALTQQQGQAEANREITAKTATRLAQNLDCELIPMLATASKVVSQGLRAVKDAGLTTMSLDFNSNKEYLQARIRIGIAGKDQPSPSPFLTEDLDLAIGVHQSLVNEAAREALGGKTFSMKDPNHIYDQATLKLLRDDGGDPKDFAKSFTKLLADLGASAATITFTRVDPLTIAFVEQGFTLEMHVASIQIDRTKYPGLRVRATYALDNAKEGVQAKRQGAIRFLAADEPPPPAVVVQMRDLVFAEIMKDRIALGSFPLTEAATSLRLLPPRAGSRDGWLGLGWKLAPRPK